MKQIAIETKPELNDSAWLAESFAENVLRKLCRLIIIFFKFTTASLHHFLVQYHCNISHFRKVPLVLAWKLILEGLVY